MDKQSFFVDVKDLVEEYVDDRMLLFRLQLTEKAAKGSSIAFILIIVGIFSLLILMIFSFLAGYYLSKAVGSYAGGFGILAAIYLLLIVVLLYIHKKHTSKIVIDKVIKFSFENEENRQL